MMGRLNLRTRLTLVITLVFGVTLTATAIVGMRAVRRELLDDTRANAQKVLGAGVAALSEDIDPRDQPGLTEFFYVDARGREISADTFADQMGWPTDSFAEEPCDESSPAHGITFESSPCETPSAGRRGADARRSTADALDRVSDPTSFFAVVSDVKIVDRETDAVSVVQMLESDHGHAGFGVSIPLQPVTDSLDTFRRLLWFGVPMLVALVGVITWLVVGRVLAPVHAISSQVRAITSSNIAERVPVYAGNDEISELASTMNEMLGRLQTAQQQQRQLVSDASHELRSPVAASRAQLEVAIAHPEGVDWVATGATVLAEQERLGKLIDDLLAASRLDEQVSAFGGGIDAVEVDLDEVVLDDARRVRIVPIRTTIDAPVRLSGDPERLTRIVRNLVDNAARHAQTEVQVTVSTISGYAILHVDDDGPGVDPAHREVIFERFTRLDEARSRGRGGTGLGLAIARAAARSYRGDITVSSSPSGGARFTVTFPISTSLRSMRA